MPGRYTGLWHGRLICCRLDTVDDGSTRPGSRASVVVLAAGRFDGGLPGRAGGRTILRLAQDERGRFGRPGLPRRCAPRNDRRFRTNGGSPSPQPSPIEGEGALSGLRTNGPVGRCYVATGSTRRYTGDVRGPRRARNLRRYALAQCKIDRNLQPQQLSTFRPLAIKCVHAIH